MDCLRDREFLPIAEILQRGGRVLIPYNSAGGPSPQLVAIHVGSLKSIASDRDIGYLDALDFRGERCMEFDLLQLSHGIEPGHGKAFSAPRRPALRY